MSQDTKTSNVVSVSSSDGEVLTASEAAKLLRVSKPAIYTLAKTEPGFPVRKVGNKLRFSRHALIAWIGKVA